MMTREGRVSIFGWAIGTLLLLGLVVFIHYSVGWEPLLTPWREIPPGVLVVACLMVLVSYGIRTIRIHEYFLPATAGSFFRTVRLVLVHNLFNNLLPMRSGEASFPILMARDFKVPFSRSIPGLLYLRVLDLHFVLLLGLAVLSWGKENLAWLLVLPLLPIPYGIFKAQEGLRTRLGKPRNRWTKIAQDLLAGLPASSGLFWRSWLWTVVNWSVKLTVLAWILQAFTPMPLSWALLGTTTGELSSVLPIHGIAGAGTYEGGILAGLLPLGVELEPALKAAVNLHLFVLGVSIFAGVLAAILSLEPATSRNRRKLQDETGGIPTRTEEGAGPDHRSGGSDPVS